MSEKYKEILDQQEVLSRKLRFGLPSERLQKIYEMTEKIARPPVLPSQELMATVARFQSRELMPCLSTITAYREESNKFLNGALSNMRAILPVFNGPEVFQKEIAARKAFRETFRLPDLEEISQLGISSFSKNGFAASIFSSLEFQADLKMKMACMQHPWINNDNVIGSSQAFAEMHAIGRLVNGPSPFNESVSTSLRTELGDWRDLEIPVTDPLEDPQSRIALYVDRGFNPSLTDFTIEAFDEGMESAGLGAYPDDDIAHIEVDEKGLARCQNAYRMLVLFEIHVRKFIADSMLAQYGGEWMKNQLPPQMYDQWRLKAEKAKKAGDAPRNLIEYADFTDYKLIIERKDNWKSVFCAIFERQENIRESFQRLYPVRIATMHSRIITLDDELYIRSETRRVLSALKKFST